MTEKKPAKQWTVRFTNKAPEETITCDEVEWPSEKSPYQYLTFFRDNDVVAKIPMANVLSIVTYQ